MKFKIGDKVECTRYVKYIIGIIIKIEYGWDKGPYRVQYGENKGSSMFDEEDLHLINRKNNWDIESL